MEIRELNGKELDGVAKWITEAFLNTDGLNLSEKGMHSVFDYIETHGESLSYFGAFEEDRMTGLLGYDTDRFHLALCFVRTEMRGKGIGHELLKHFISFAGRQQIARITVHASEDAEKMYREFGFEPCGDFLDFQGVKVRPMEYLLDRSALGQAVHVTVDRPMGTFHEHYPDLIYPCNFGYVDEVLKDSGEFQDAYVIGPEEPVEVFEGVVVAVIYRSDDLTSRWVVAKDRTVAHEQIINTIGLLEQYHDTRMIWLDEKR